MKARRYGYWLIWILLFFAFQASGWNVSSILQSQNKKDLNQVLLKNQEQKFQSYFCVHQKQSKQTALACLNSSFSQKKGVKFLQSDDWCLQLKIENLDSSTLKNLIKKPQLSSFCRKYLLQKKKVLDYRLQDDLLELLKRQW